MLRRRYLVAWDSGTPTADLEARITLLQTQIEILEQVERELLAGYAPVRA